MHSLRHWRVESGEHVYLFIYCVVSASAASPSAGANVASCRAALNFKVLVSGWDTNLMAKATPGWCTLEVSSHCVCFRFAVCRRPQTLSWGGIGFLPGHFSPPNWFWCQSSAAISAIAAVVMVIIGLLWEYCCHNATRSVVYRHLHTGLTVWWRIKNVSKASSCCIDINILWPGCAASCYGKPAGLFGLGWKQPPTKYQRHNNAHD